MNSGEKIGTRRRFVSSFSNSCWAIVKSPQRFESTNVGPFNSKRFGLRVLTAV
jgi:hypothetical protein